MSESYELQKRETREDHGLANALAWFQSIKEMVEALEKAERTDSDDVSESYIDEARNRIFESVLSVEVRTGWYSYSDSEPVAPAEYRILLTTGGPACQLVGELSEHGEPVSASLQAQDWGTPWTRIANEDLTQPQPASKTYNDEWMAKIESVQEILLTFARQFYFGEG